jgi:predicted dienelactone hydrolase
MQHVFTSDRDGTPIAIAMWYPSATPAATPDAAIVGDALPFVLIAPESADASVGHGDTALALANAGFVVATVEHTGVDPRIQGGIGHIMDRSQQVQRELNYVLADWNLRAHVDPARLGIFGSGEGGFAALVAIGGQPDLTTIPEHCNQFPQEPACRLIADATPASGGLSVVAMERPTETRFKAAVIAAPDFGFTFANGALKDVTVPVQLWRAGDDALLPTKEYLQPIFDGLPGAPQYTVVANAEHDDFLAPCTAEVAKESPAQCTSEAGFSRTAFHQRLNAAIVTFFKQTLKAAT